MHLRRAVTLCLLGACQGQATSSRPFEFDVEAPPDATVDAPEVTARDVARAPEVLVSPDVAPVRRDVVEDFSLSPDAACSRVGVAAQLERLPVDIVWIVDNSVSMAPAIDEIIRGLNRFATVVASRGLDYRVVMLSLRNVNRDVTVPDGRRYAVCIPPPLAGDSRCGNGPRFLHASVDIRSIQPLEQLLGTLGQTMGYTADQPRGGEAWRSFLRPAATKSFVVVTDDQSRLTAAQFETFAGGVNPSSRSFTLPPGILDPSWAGLFTGYTFHGIYGWGDERNPATRCMYPGGTMPPASGTVYTDLVTRTGGVRARICDGADAWGPFFDRVATAVERNSRIQCDLAIPAAPDGSVLDARRVNVAIQGTTETLLGKVAGASACGARGGWYYDNEARPTRVVLCPVSCERANAEVRAGMARIDVQFGCLTIPG